MASFRQPAASNLKRATQHLPGVGWPILADLSDEKARLKARTTYYYAVDSMEANGKRDRVKSTVKHFTTPQ